MAIYLIGGIIIKNTDTGYSRYTPSLPGCITVGDTHQFISGISVFKGRAYAKSQNHHLI
ncbi:hypothetical protein Aasi_0087 [Candidatus Amoebophilus asiaticus 5a2]|uniref:Uncharacterized protein n=1 Tax=Amoebophilus asiaticus (strain 5a2) TaxID=452471 RepID=B3EUB6_AMOA5|nr:hypothetical protein Aasi_0087 [Candidatus Amoebophilus asiaticus 5a2]